MATQAAVIAYRDEAIRALMFKSDPEVIVMSPLMHDMITFEVLAQGTDRRRAKREWRKLVARYKAGQR